MTSQLTDHKILVLFDGVCNLCNASVQFIIRRDRHDRFRFASLQSDAARAILQRFHVAPESMHSVIVIDGDRAYERSDAALHIAARLGGIWRLLSFLRIVPRPLRDLLYNWIARHRYSWFGKRNECMIPTPELRSRFLSD